MTFLLLTLAACTAAVQDEAAAMYTAIYEGIIAVPGSILERDVTRNTVPVRRADMTRSMEAVISPGFFGVHHMAFGGFGGFRAFSGMFVEPGQRVQAGDALAALYTVGGAGQFVLAMTHEFELYPERWDNGNFVGTQPLMPPSAEWLQNLQGGAAGAGTVGNLVQGPTPGLAPPGHFSAADAIAWERLANQYTDFMTRTAEDYQRRQIEIMNLQSAIPLAQDDELILLHLRLERAEIELARFIRASIITQENFHEGLGIDGQGDPTEGWDILRAPIDGVVLDGMFWLGRGTVMPSGGAAGISGATIVTVVDDSRIYFGAQGLPTVFRYGKTYMIYSVGGMTRVGLYIDEDGLMHPTATTYDFDIAFEATMAADPLAPGPRPLIAQFTFRPANPEAFAAMLARYNLTHLEVARMGNLRIATSEVLAANTLILPYRALRPEEGLYYVYVYDAGNLLKRYVTLGLRFGDDVQILYGLHDGQEVVILP